MKSKSSIIILLVISLLLTGCSLSINGKNVKVITPSKTLITETRNVSGFSGINLSTFGMMTITQGDKDALTIKGSDNIIPLIRTTVTNGVLDISMDDNYSVISTDSANELTYTITVKDLSNLSLSGAGKVMMDALTTQTLAVTLSGAGHVAMNNLAIDTLDITLSGMGGVDLVGNAATAKIKIAGAGSIKAGDLKIQSADVTISGIGGASLWVTDRLTGNINGGGEVFYYGNPQTDIKTTGAGQFKSLGNK